MCNLFLPMQLIENLLSHSKDPQNYSQLLLVKAVSVISAAFISELIFTSPFPWVGFIAKEAD